MVRLSKVVRAAVIKNATARMETASERATTNASAISASPTNDTAIAPIAPALRVSAISLSTVSSGDTAALPYGRMGTHSEGQLSEETSPQPTSSAGALGGPAGPVASPRCGVQGAPSVRSVGATFLSRYHARNVAGIPIATRMSLLREYQSRPRRDKNVAPTRLLRHPPRVNIALTRGVRCRELVLGRSVDQPFAHRVLVQVLETDL